jgi:hypothetical protein
LPKAQTRHADRIKRQVNRRRTGQGALLSAGDSSAINSPAPPSTGASHPIVGEKRADTGEVAVCSTTSAPPELYEHMEA